jgi:ketosteroid isomerase-like protein
VENEAGGESMSNDQAVSEGVRNANIVRQYLATFEKKDKDALMAFVTDETVIEMPLNESGLVEEENIRKFAGLEQLDKFFQGVVTAFAAGDHVTMDYMDISEANDGRTIFLECRGGARMANGRTYRNRYCMRYDFRDGKIMRLREYYNPIATAYSFDRLLAGQFKVETLAS